MDQLPNHKVPRVDSQGDKYRDQQIIKQLPKQDLSDLYCRYLDGETERKEFNIFRELRDQVAMGIGVVRECQDNTVGQGQSKVRGCQDNTTGQGQYKVMLW